MNPWRAGGWRGRVHAVRVRIEHARLPRWLSAPMHRAGDIVFDDPTRNLQLSTGLFVLLLGWNAVSTPAVTPHTTNVVLYWWASRVAWGWARLLLGVAQMVIATRPRNAWRWKIAVAQVQIGLAGYSMVATVLTTDPGFAVSQVWLLAVETWIASRALYDRDMNGTDRRLRPSGEQPGDAR